MKLHESKLFQFLENLPKTKKVFLLHGTAESKVFYYRKLIEKKLLGQHARSEMRLVALDRSSLNKDKSLLLNEMKTRSFFGGQKGIIIENIGEKEAPIVLEALESLEEEDPYLIMTASFLKQSSKLRKSIETNIYSCSVGFYQEEMTSAEVQNLLQRWKINWSDNNVIDTLTDFSKSHDFLEFRQELQKLALYKNFDKTPLSLIELEEVFSSESNPNEKNLIDHLIQRHQEPILDYFRNFPGTIKSPASLVTRATNQFRTLHKLRCHEGNATHVLRNVWPPIIGKNRDRLIATSRTWEITNLEHAIQILRNIGLNLRKNSKISSKTLLISGFLEICLLNN